VSVVPPKTRVKLADEVWIVVALLHREHPDRMEFSVEEIMTRARKEAITKPWRPGFYVHVIQHCVANRPPNPGRYRVLLETPSGRRRLFRLGDTYHPQRAEGKIHPSSDEIPEQYRGLLEWYRKWSASGMRDRVESDPLLALRGSGRRLWADEHADEYVRHLREGWE